MIAIHIYKNKRDNVIKLTEEGFVAYGAAAKAEGNLQKSVEVKEEVKVPKVEKKAAKKSKVSEIDRLMAEADAIEAELNKMLSK